MGYGRWRLTELIGDKAARPRERGYAWPRNATSDHVDATHLHRWDRAGV